MDVDWCLSCERKLDDHLLGPYCSPQCLSYAQPSSSSSSSRIRPDSGALRIHQWARAIPPHIPAGAPTLPFADLPLSSPSLFTSDRPPSPRPRHQPTPKLIERTAACTPLPTLCVSSPAHVRPPVPARAQPYSHPNTSTCLSEASTSLTSLLTEPMVSTPDEDASFGANIGALVRCWVCRDRSNSTRSTHNDCIIEKVTDYFPPLPHPKKTAQTVPSKKSKKSPVPSPAPITRLKPSPKKVASPDRDHSTPTHSHTPTPVIFPSCRAWVDDDDDDNDESQEELFVAPQPQYHPSYYQKYHPPQQVDVHWSRGPSFSSVSSDSSVLLMARKRTDGRKGAIVA